MYLWEARFHTHEERRGEAFHGVGHVCEESVVAESAEDAIEILKADVLDDEFDEDGSRTVSIVLMGIERIRAVDHPFSLGKLPERPTP